MPSKFTTLLLLLLCNSICAVSQTITEAINKKDTIQAATIIKNGYDINSVDANGNSALLTACRFANNDTAVICFLLRNGAKPDFPRSPKDRTALIVVCAYYGGVPTCRVLVNAAANVNAVANDGTTALTKAAANDKADVVAYLLSKGANAKLKDAAGKTALDYANESKLDETMIKMLPNCKVDKDETIKLLKPYSN